MLPTDQKEDQKEEQKSKIDERHTAFNDSWMNHKYAPAIFRVSNYITSEIDPDMYLKASGEVI